MGEFDPSKYLTKVGSADYLEVKWRLVWLREKHPDASIDTDLMSPTDTGEAVFKARIVVPGGGSATGWGSETQDDFRDYLEKAETKALGRALAALGFGTQFSPDHDFGGAEGKVVDTPVTRPKPTNGKPSAELVRPAPTNERAPSLYPATREQLNKDLHREADLRGLSHEDLHAIVVGQGGKSVADLSVPQLEKFVKWIREKNPPTIQKAIDAGRDPATLGAK